MSRDARQLQEQIVDRRSVIMATGSGLGLTAAGAFGGTGELSSAAEHDNGGDEGGDDGGDDGPVRPVFGYAARADEEPPVEPDYEVELLERDVERDDVPFELEEYFFDPTGLSVEPGETVQFRFGEGHTVHTVTGYHPAVGYEQRVPDEPISSTVLFPETYFLYTFDEPGVYDLFCFPHEFLGMVVRVVVGEATGPGAEPVPEPEFNMEEPATSGELLTPQGLGAQVLRDPALDPENIMDQGQVAWDDVDESSKRFPEGQFEEPPMAPGEEEQAPLVATLTPGEETADVESDASGCATFHPADDGLHYHLHAQDIEDVTQAHIHEGKRGEDGPVVAGLLQFTEAVDGTGEGDPRSGTLEDPISVTGTVEDNELVEAILECPTRYYVNVHTTEYPPGEIRGQITHSGGDSEPSDGDDQDDDGGEDGDDY